MFVLNKRPKKVGVPGFSYPHWSEWTSKWKTISVQVTLLHHFYVQMKPFSWSMMLWWYLSHIPITSLKTCCPQNILRCLFRFLILKCCDTNALTLWKPRHIFYLSKKTLICFFRWYLIGATHTRPFLSGLTAVGSNNLAVGMKNQILRKKKNKNTRKMEGRSDEN